MKREVPKEAKDEAVRIAIDGGDPIEYLGKYSINPRGMWTYIRGVLKDKDPETFAKIPNLRANPPKKVQRVEKPKPPKPTAKKTQNRPVKKKPVPELVLDENGLRVGLKREPELQILRVRSVQTDVMYYLSDDRERLVMDNGGDVFNMSVAQLPDFLNELPPICRHLGVKV